ncbi:hypothetical protein NDU88_001491 [Pleurodeles waltl]|uniref:Uncharacterized protein n=1 Tax=Pleurodeles waltl TaxID=8319 RepID=A0AAV7WLN4_PLEWA|nr:hypothetical protein NDU88_001491 [Pleurodeles waltl]
MLTVDYDEDSLEEGMVWNGEEPTEALIAQEREEWPEQRKAGDEALDFLELFLLVVAIMFNVDNVSVVQVVNRQSAWDAQLMHVFVLGCLRHDISLRAQHVPEVDNDILGALSR